jgi:hypothetical protein
MLEKCVRLRLDDLHERHPGLTQGMARVFFEAASVCLARHHSSPANFTIERESSKTEARVDWLPISPGLSAAYANTIDATEAGAYGMCLAALELNAGLVAIQRAETLTGADYYVAPRGSAIDDLEVAFRFEVSGIDKGRRALCDQRLRAKIKQTQEPDHATPAIAGVTGFEQQLVLLSQAIES